MTNRKECFIARIVFNHVKLYGEDGHVVATFDDADTFERVMGLNIQDYNNRSMAAYVAEVDDSASLARKNID